MKKLTQLIMLVTGFGYGLLAAAQQLEPGGAAGVVGGLLIGIAGGGPSNAVIPEPGVLPLLATGTVVGIAVKYYIGRKK